MKTLPQPWTAAMEATVFTGWIYDLKLGSFRVTADIPVSRQLRLVLPNIH
jgi:hypothetical protein